jgi:hypothetical protein
MLTIHTYIALPFAAWPTHAAGHNYKLFTLNCKLISTPPSEGIRYNDIRADKALTDI